MAEVIVAGIADLPSFDEPFRSGIRPLNSWLRQVVKRDAVRAVICCACLLTPQRIFPTREAMGVTSTVPRIDKHVGVHHESAVAVAVPSVKAWCQ